MTVLAQALAWGTFFEQVLPQAIEAIKVLHQKFASEPDKAIQALREVADHWQGADVENNAFRARIAKVQADAVKDLGTDQPTPVDAPEPQPADLDEPEPQPVEPAGAWSDDTAK